MGLADKKISTTGNANEYRSRGKQHSEILFRERIGNIQTKLQSAVPSHTSVEAPSQLTSQSEKRIYDYVTRTDQLVTSQNSRPLLICPFRSRGRKEVILNG